MIMRKLGYLIYGALCVLMLIFVLSFEVDAYDNSTSNGSVIIDDEANLLTKSEEELLEEQMLEITQYGKVAFVTISTNNASTESYIRNYYRNHFGTSSGVVFLIDMDNRNIWLYCDGTISRRIDDDYTEVITDNVYTYATEGDYYLCAQKTFEQISTLLEGGRISQPMKYICNALLAISTALILNFLLLRMTTSTKKEEEEESLERANYIYHLKNAGMEYLYTDRKYSPQSSGSSGGRGGGGGGSSGGHSF